MTTHNTYGHNGRPNTSDNLASVEKSGYASPAKIEYTVDLATPPASATAFSGLPSSSSADASFAATARAATAAVGASVASDPEAKSPEVNQVRGAGAFRRVTGPTLAHAAGPGATATLTLPSVRIIGHNGEVMTVPTLRTVSPTTVADEASAGLMALRRVCVPSRRAAFFATDIAVPSKGQRRQAYLTLELLPAALASEARLKGVNAVIEGSPRKIGRADRSRVLANLVDVVAQVSPNVRVGADLLAGALAALTSDEKLLQPANGAPRVLIVDGSERAFFVETHPARKALGTADAWMAGRVVGHCALGHHIPGFSGVLVFTVRSRKPVHYVTPTNSHDLGDCEQCAEVTR